MKGKLKNKNNEWYVTHITDDNGILFGVDYPLNPTLEKYYFLDEDAENGEVDFELITIDNGDNGVRYANLLKKSKSSSEHTFINYTSINPKYFGEYNFKNYSYAECSFCGDKTEGVGKFICEECSNALKELILEKKEYIKKYKSGNPG